MTKVIPFKGLVYNHNKIKDLFKVVCPPYDVISAQQQDKYMESDKYNFIHVLLRKESEGEARYMKAASLFKDWQKEKVLIQQENPALYFYSQQYTIRGEKKTRFGFIALLRLEDENNSVFRHEHTRIGPKEDRLKLLREVKANLSPIFVVFRDKKRIIQRTFEQHINEENPFMEVVSAEDHIVHRVWRVDSSDLIANIQKSLSAEDIFIADGHHRYEVACAYRQEQRDKGQVKSDDDPVNYIMAYFTNTDQRGLSILPIQRLLKLEKELDTLTFIESLKEYFDVEEVKEKTKFFFLMEKGGRSEHVIGMYKDKRFFLLRLKNIRILDKLISDKPKDYRTLDVSVLNHIVFKNILGYNETRKEDLTYSHEAQDFIEQVDNDRLTIAFFMNPVKIEQIISVALNGERMPAKSTFFYPKVLSGLVVNKLSE